MLFVIKRVQLELKGKLYRTTIRSAMLYKTKCWAVKVNKKIS